MKMKHRGPVGVMLLMAFAILVLLYPLQTNIEQAMQQKQTTARETGEYISEVNAGSMSGLLHFLQLAGLNSLLADVLWMKADDLWHSASWWQMAPVMETIVRIDPKFTMVWRILAWHYGWNLYIASRTAVERAGYLDSAARTYEEALKNNPDNFDLWWDQAWLYWDKLRNYERAEDSFKRMYNKYPNDVRVERALQHLYEKTWRIDEAKKVIAHIRKKYPDDYFGKRDMEWWTKTGKDENYRWIMEVKENISREGRDLPFFVNPFEGKTVKGNYIDVPPWRDESRPDHMNPDWKPDLRKYDKDTVAMVLKAYPEYTPVWVAAHPEYKDIYEKTGYVEPPEPATAPKSNFAQGTSKQLPPFEGYNIKGMPGGNDYNIPEDAWRQSGLGRDDWLKMSVEERQKLATKLGGHLFIPGEKPK
jgi:tetratricopeptide (TPR) repeat protein